MDDLRNNNFDFFRLLFATFVVITHSYVLTGNDQIDFLFQATAGKISLSYIGVRGFFIISGYLIFQSLSRSKNILDYLWKRFLRLFPGLTVMLIFTLCLVPLVYDNWGKPLLQNDSYLTYLPHNLILYTPQFTIDGVFESNPFKSSINGSLWTIQYEFTLYLILLLLYFVRNNSVLIKILLSISVFSLLLGNTIFYEFLKIYDAHLLEFGYFFFSGSLLSAWGFGQIGNKNKYILLFMSILIMSIPFASFSFLKFLTLPVVIILASTSSTTFINSIGKRIGDLSYGIYIYAFPIQQTIVHFTKCNTIQLVISSLITTIIIAALSWHLVEKKALAWKSIFKKR